ncbi:MAG: hypothetical protein ACJ8DI_11380 [Ktedonobacteraceae bacterium]
MAHREGIAAITLNSHVARWQQCRIVLRIKKALPPSPSMAMATKKCRATRWHPTMLGPLAHVSDIPV